MSKGLKACLNEAKEELGFSTEAVPPIWLRHRVSQLAKLHKLDGRIDTQLVVAIIMAEQEARNDSKTKA